MFAAACTAATEAQDGRQGAGDGKGDLPGYFFCKPDTKELEEVAVSQLGPRLCNFGDRGAHSKVAIVVSVDRQVVAPRFASVEHCEYFLGRVGERRDQLKVIRRSRELRAYVDIGIRARTAYAAFSSYAIAPAGVEPLRGGSSGSADRNGHPLPLAQRLRDFEKPKVAPRKRNDYSVADAQIQNVCSCLEQRCSRPKFWRIAGASFPRRVAFAYAFLPGCGVPTCA